MKTLFQTARLGWLGAVCALAIACTAPLPAALPSPEGAQIPGPRGTPLPGVPPLPATTPVSFFRKLLSLPASERVMALADRTAANRSVIEQKLQEYESLAEADRNARLQALEFHYYMKTLMSAPPSIRKAWQESVPREYRALCEERLRLWSVLPPPLQQYIKDQDTTLRWLTRWEGATEQERAALLASVPPERRTEMEKHVADWRSMTPAQRDQAWRATRQMFEMSPRDQNRVLVSLTESNRLHAARFLESLRNVPLQQRELYLDGFKKFSRMDVADRARLVQGWERWKQLSEPERDMWRQLQARAPKPRPSPSPDR